MITIWKTPIVATVEQVLKDLKLQLYGAGLLKEIKNTGSDLMCTCPFHANGKEHNPSCGVLLQQKVTKDKTYEAGTVHCYTCGYTADLPQFVADLLGLSSPVEGFRYMDDMVIFGSSKEELHKLKRELDEFMAVNLKQVLKHNWQVFPTKVRGVDFVGYRFFGEYTLLRKSTCKTFKRRMLSISSKRENNVSPTYSEWCSFNSYVGWLQHCDSFRLYQKYVEPNVEYMHNYYLKEVKGNAEICKRKNYSGERKAS